VTQPPQLFPVAFSPPYFYHFPCPIFALSWGFTRLLFGETLLGKHLASSNYFEGRADGKLNFLKTFLSLFQLCLNYFNNLGTASKEIHKIKNDVVV